MPPKPALPKGLKSREKSLQQQTPPASPPKSVSTQESSSAPSIDKTPKRNPFEKAERTLWIFVSIVLWLYIIGLVTGKPLLGVLLADPVNTIKEILLGPFKVVGNIIGVDVETLLFGVKTAAETVVKPAVVDEF
ncbi:UNVERIFIED_CONTAM: hypothetical protein HDU68_006961 [Siphonaria sp. JEL0065]|nr:hypothetical protein HDU68_006961 [Siphonaria sp. JEL0065]